MKKEIKVLVVDDSAVARQKISKILTDSKKGIKVVGTAPNGRIALTKMILRKYKPDIVTMDIMMPEMDGFETIGHIMDRFPLPIIIVSSLSQKDVDTNLGMAAFESGVVEFVKKPDSKNPSENKRFQRELLMKIISLSQINLTQALQGFDFETFLEDEKPKVIKKTKKRAQVLRETIIVIGASTGGPRAISLVLSKIPPSFPAVVVVQHMPEQMVKPWAERLQSLYPKLNIKIPLNNEIIKPNYIYIAPGGKHCAIREGKRFNLFTGKKVNFLMPAIDVTLETSIKAYNGENIICVILTGMGKDGFVGARKIKANGGRVIAEHESTCVIYGMPKAIVEAEFADMVIPLHDIPRALSNIKWI